MLKSAGGVLAALALGAGLAYAKLPPPTPEEQAAAAAKKAKEAEQAKQQQQALEKAQDRVVQHYRKSTASATGSGTAGPTEVGKMPKTTTELPGGVGPEPTRPPSAEAHSGQNR